MTKSKDKKLSPLHSRLLLGKKVLVTGGTTGIGRAISLCLSAVGAKVLTFGRSLKELNDAMNDITKAEGEIIGMTADLTNEKDFKKVFAVVKQKLGGLDILVNNAGLGGGDLFKEDFQSSKLLFEVNSLGYISFAKKAVEIFEKQKYGHIVNIGSMSANTKDAGSEIYNATKSAVQSFTDSLRKRVNPLGIKVTLIEPGSVGTNMQSIGPDKQQKLQEQGKMLMAEDIASTVLFAVTQPERSEIMTIQIKPHQQFI